MIHVWLFPFVFIYYYSFIYLYQLRMCSHHMETNPLICFGNEFTDFKIITTLTLSGLNSVREGDGFPSRQ